MSEWITVKEAAELLGISRRQVINRIHEGKLKAKRDNTKWLVHSSLSEPDEEVSLEVPATSGKFQEEVGYLQEQSFATPGSAGIPARTESYTAVRMTALPI